MPILDGISANTRVRLLSCESSLRADEKKRFSGVARFGGDARRLGADAFYYDRIFGAGAFYYDAGSALWPKMYVRHLMGHFSN